jgi:hypothetical protein
MSTPQPVGYLSTPYKPPLEIPKGRGAKHQAEGVHRGPARIRIGGSPTSRGGRIGGNILDFVACMEGSSIRDAAIRLQDRFSTTGDTLRHHEGGAGHWRAPSSIQPELAESPTVCRG